MLSACSACTAHQKKKNQKPSQPPRMRPCSYAAGDTHWAGHREWLDRKSYLVSCWRSPLGSPKLNWLEHAHFQSIRFAFLRAGPAPKMPAGGPPPQPTRPPPPGGTRKIDGNPVSGPRALGG